MGIPGERFPGYGRQGMGQRRGGVRWWVLVLAALYFGWYWFSHQQEAAFTGRTQLIDTSIEEEAQLGLQAWQETLAQSETVRGGPLPEQVSTIARRLVEVGPAVEQYLAKAHGVPATTRWDAFQWEVAVIESPQVNAFCLPGGKIAVYTGIIPVARNEHALAAIMGHEIAHALLRHGAERMAQQKLVQIGQVAASMSIGDMDPRQQQMVMAALGAGARYGLVLPFSRDHETEADRVGLMLAAAACYDPRESIGLWERMGQASGGGAPPEFMSTHPAGATRIQQLQAWMPEALALREASGCPPLP
ncbi:MAG: M48 family metallopeptidase [Xanthomonadaceae bacterium]|nr:M48 family metallopeptidase [Xanthomonadaceae bacterium]